MIENLLQAEHRLAQTQLELDFREIEQISSTLAEEQERYVLYRSINEDTLFDHIFSSEELDVLSQLQLEEEIFNPVYENLRERMVDVQIDQFTVPEPQRINFQEERPEFFSGNIGDYRAEIDLYQQDVDHYQELYTQEAEKYRELRNESLNFEYEITELTAEIDYYESRQQELTQQVEELESQFWRYEREIETVKRDVNRYEQSYEKLSSQMEDARLASAEQTSDVRFVSAAVPPGRKIGENVKLNMAIAAVLAGMLGIFGVSFQEFMKEDEDA